jgi:uncharacterized membrane protein
MADRRQADEGRGRQRGYWRSIRERKNEIISVREEQSKGRGWLAGAIDRTGNLLAHPGFFFSMATLHAAWLLLNTGWIPGVRPWDPYPFVMLATIASVEAPFIALLVLMRQHRDQRIDELREEVSLQVNLHVEREATRTLRMLRRIEEHLGLERDEEDPHLDRMMEDLDPRHLLAEVEESLEESDAPPPGDADREG